MATGALNHYRQHNVSNDRTSGIGEMCNDVSITAPLHGQVLQYDGPSQHWKNGPGAPPGVDKFLDLLDTPATYTTPLSLYRVNAAKTGVDEVDVQLSIPAANQFKITSGTTDLTCTADCTLNQDLATTSSPTFYFLNATRVTSTDFHTGVPPVGGNRYIRTGVGDFMCGIEFVRDQEAIGLTARGDVRICIDAGSTSLYRKFEICHNHYGWSANNYCFTVEETGNVGLYGRMSWNGESTYVASIKDEDDMASNSDHALPTQQSVKAYVDSKVTSSETTTSATLTLTGIWTDPRGIYVYYARTGSVVCAHFTGTFHTATTSATITSSNALPVSIRPTMMRDVLIRIVDNGNYSAGVMTIQPEGNIVIRTINYANFAGSGSSGILDTCVSWVI
jgi:hypothetical protein